MDSIDNMSKLIQVMACQPIGYKPIHEPMMTKYNDISSTRKDCLTFVWMTRYATVSQSGFRFILMRCLFKGLITSQSILMKVPLQWRHTEHNGVSNHHRLECLLNRLFRRRSMEISKLHVTGLYEGDSLVIGWFPAQRASNAENVSIW